MKWKDYIFIPFPRPRRNKKNVLLIILIGISASLFILIYEPFGIENNTGELFVDVIIFSLGLLFILSVLFLEFFVPTIFPNFFRKWTLGKALVWYPTLILIVGGLQFLYKSWLGGWYDFTLSEFFMVLARTLVISFTVAFFVLGIWQYLNRKRLSMITLNQQYEITTSNGKQVQLNINDILYMSSDDNYVDIHLESNAMRQKIVIRSSLKSIEAQLSNYLSPIHRCHRRYLVNVKKFKIIQDGSRKMTLGMDNYKDEVPVSTKYVPSIKNKLLIHP